MAKAKILVVEDEAITAKDIQDRLKDLGYDAPAIASSGEGAIKKAEEIKPDLVLMDIVLKGDMDGIEAAERIHDRFGIPVVYVTAYLDEERLEKTKVSEPYGYIIKPFGDKDLRPVIEMALQRHKLEKALRENEEKYRTFIEKTSEGYWSLNSEHKTSEVNKSLCDMLGYKKDEMMGKSPHDFVDEENLKIFKYQMGKIESTLHRSYEIVLKNKNGEDVFTLFNAVTIIDETGEFKGAYSLVTNITEQKKAEEALREGNAKIKSITASAYDAIIMVDNEGTISFWNEAAERIFGYSEEEMIGTKLHGAIIPERFREAALTGFKSFRETGQGAAVGKTLELAAIRKDGTEFPVELSLSAVKLKGKWNGIGVLRDITERKEVEEAIKESEERYNTLFEFAMDGILIADIETRELNYANPAICRMLGYSVEELKGMGVSEIHPKDKLEHVISEFEAQARGEKALAPNIPCLRKDGTVIYTDINTTRASIDGKDCNIGFFRDITERKRKEEELEKKNEALKRFNKLAVGRELKMIELKMEINALLEDQSKEPRYKIVGE